MYKNYTCKVLVRYALLHKELILHQAKLLALFEMSSFIFFKIYYCKKYFFNHPAFFIGRFITVVFESAVNITVAINSNLSRTKNISNEQLGI